jgi:hypothetical protein
MPAVVLHWAGVLLSQQVGHPADDSLALTFAEMLPLDREGRVMLTLVLWLDLAFHVSPSRRRHRKSVI